ncbi:MAG: CPBP family glutamic-type intramembrane protease [Microthrixaceae bacterium]
MAGDYLRFWGGRASYLPTTRPAARWFLALWGLSLSVAYATSVVVTMLVVAAGGDQPENAVGDLVENGSVLGVLLTAVVLAPLLEEVAFRLPMSLRPWHVAIGAGAFVSLFLPGMLGVSPGQWLVGATNQAAASLVELGFGVAVAVGLGVTLSHLTPLGRSDHPLRISPRVRYAVVAVLTTVFAGAHLGNFAEFTWFLPAFIIPQVLVGMVLAYVRVTRSWWMGVGVHGLNNGVAVGFALSTRAATSDAAQTLFGLGFLAMVSLLGLVAGGALGIDLYRTWSSNQSPPHPSPWPPTHHTQRWPSHPTQQAHVHPPLSPAVPPNSAPWRSP